MASFASGKPAYRGGSARTNEEIRLILVGLTGSGKSAVGNSIFRSKERRDKGVFNETTRGTSLEHKCHYHKGVSASGRKNIVVIDTPNSFDRDREIDREVAKCLLFAAPGPSAIIFVIKVNRLSDNQPHVLKRVEKLLGPNTRRYSIVLLTGKDDLDYEQVTVETFKRGAPPYMKQIFSSDLPVMAFNNRANAEENAAQVKRLLHQVDVILDQHGSAERYLTNHNFKAAEKVIQEEMSKI